MEEETPDAPFDFIAAKKAGVKYWERGRLIYLLLLFPASAAGYFMGEVVAVLTFGDTAFLSTWQILTMFFVGFVNANIAFSFAYVLEFALMGTSRYKSYIENGRTLLLVSGCVLGIILAFGTSRAIAYAKYSPSRLWGSSGSSFIPSGGVLRPTSGPQEKSTLRENQPDPASEPSALGNCHKMES